MQVSVVIPTYNCGYLVADAVKSVLAQTTPPHQIIVVDDGSTDDTKTILAGFGGSIKYIYQANSGVASARNRGIRQATGELIAFLDADDVWHPEKLERQLECMRLDTEIALLGTLTINWPVEQFGGLGLSVYSAPVVIPFDDLVVKNYLTTSSVLVRKAVLQRVGVFDTDLEVSEDYELWIRIARTFRIANLPTRLTGYRDTAGSLSKLALKMETGMQCILDRLEHRGIFRGKPLLRRKAWGYFRFSCAYMYGAAGMYSLALARLVLSLTGYPIPYLHGETKVPLGRLRLLARTIPRWIRSQC